MTNNQTNKAQTEATTSTQSRKHNTKKETKTSDKMAIIKRKNEKYGASVIGGGIAGMASAIRLSQKQGLKVTLFETNAHLGGKLSEVKHNGYRFDMGPSLLTLPHLIDELFELSGKNPRNYINFDRLHVVCKYFYEDGTQINAYGNPQKFALEIEQKTGVPQKKVLEYLEWSKTVYELVDELFTKQSLHTNTAFFSTKALKAVLNIRTLKLFKTIHQHNEGFFNNQKIVQLFDRFATYNGSNPYKAPAILGLIAHIEHNLGAYLPQGGMAQITKALETLMVENGVEIIKNAKVEEIIVQDFAVKAIKANGFNSLTSIVVSNADVETTYKHLIPKYAYTRNDKNDTRSTSAIVFYWGINKQFAQLDVHNIFFSQDYQNEFEMMESGRYICNDPTIYVYISSKLNKKDAPEGCENWFTMINVSHNKGQDWDTLVKTARKTMIEKLNRILNIDLEKHIVAQEILDPRTLETKTSAFRGAIYGTNFNSRYAFFTRHKNLNPTIDNLYFVGGTVHPGAGLPMCLCSAKIVDELIGK